MLNEDELAHYGPIFWWSWRPGINPLKALLLGGGISLVTLCLASIGLLTLVLGIMDNLSPPSRTSATVIAHTAATTSALPRLTLRLQPPNSATTLSSAISPVTFSAIPDNASVQLLFSPRLQILYGLEYQGKMYLLPGTSSAGNPPASIALLLLGLAMLIYPARLTIWAYRDLLIEHANQQEFTIVTGQIIGTRATTRRQARPGVLPRGSNPWYGIALIPANAALPLRPLTLSVSEEQYHTIKTGTQAKVTYSPHLHYVYALEPING